MTLRTRLIEAGARWHHEAQRAHFHPDWEPFDDLGDFGQRSVREFMAAAFDAMLNFLTESADEWAQTSLVDDEAVEDWRHGHSVEIVWRLIAVLREDK